MAEPPRLPGFDLRGRRAIVYGADTPVGAAIVAALREAGAIVAVTSSATDGNALFRMKRAAKGGPMEAADLSNGTSVQVATKKIAKRSGRAGHRHRDAGGRLRSAHRQDRRGRS